MAFEIETLDDLIAASSCCCGPVLCPVPVAECESVTVNAGSSGFFDPADTEWIIYTSKVSTETVSLSFSDTYNNNSHSAFESFTEERNRNFSASGTIEGCNVYASTLTHSCLTEGSASYLYYFDGVTLTYSRTVTRTQTGSGGFGTGCTWEDLYVDTEHDVDPPAVTETTEYNVGITTAYPSSDSVTNTETYGGAATYTEWVAGVIAEVAASAAFNAECVSDSCVASMAVTAEPETTGGSLAMTMVLARNTYRIPHQWIDPISGLTVAFPGTYFKITYDVLFTPTTGSPSFDSEDNVIEWTGPGTGDADDPSWVIGTVDLDPPSAPGTLSVVNLRFTCRDEGMFANIPQVAGASYP